MLIICMISIPVANNGLRAFLTKTWERKTNRKTAPWGIKLTFLLCTGIKPGVKPPLLLFRPDSMKQRTIWHTVRQPATTTCLQKPFHLSISVVFLEMWVHVGEYWKTYHSLFIRRIWTGGSIRIKSTTKKVFAITEWVYSISKSKRPLCCPQFIYCKEA